MPVITFSVCGIPVDLHSASGELLALYQNYFHYYLTLAKIGQIPSDASPDAQPVLAINLELTVALAPLEQLRSPEAELLAEAGPIKLWRDTSQGEEQFYFQTAATSFLARPASGQLEGTISRQALRQPNILVNTFTLFPLLLLLRQRARYHLHAGAVFSPDGRLYLICGEQRAGKSTLTTALGLAGWCPIADDSLFLQEQQGAARLSAFKRDFHISTEILNGWPALARATRRDQYCDRTSIAALEFFDTLSIAEQRFGQVHCVIFPHLTGDAESHLEQLSAGEATLKLAEQCMYFPLWREHTLRQLGLLTELMRGARYYRLLAGTDVLTSPERVAALL